MSARPISAKQERKQRKLFRATPESYIDVYQWLKLRHDITSGSCKALLRGGAIKVDSHPIKERFVPAEWRDRLTIVDPETGAPIGV